MSSTTTKNVLSFSQLMAADQDEEEAIARLNKAVRVADEDERPPPGLSSSSSLSRGLTVNTALKSLKRDIVDRLRNNSIIHRRRGTYTLNDNIALSTLSPSGETAAASLSKMPVNNDAEYLVMDETKNAVVQDDDVVDYEDLIIDESFKGLIEDENEEFKNNKKSQHNSHYRCVYLI